ncbi:uncharacterized protein K444DRAFT_719297 [Hyaloscypha bicolor E]|uniref:Uncharacterized protein n=1 Tax=Hyaloscypha bicolor E TaxID=1095630 RepID=A0A2J6TE33_9HELO|nr:uncharacterized protein K444DRAFT_719297 [Hyaloscypha bicolor E]PMD61208.1 hypothetical protein K444DRAFT_719297 [Hyaloscypha bicolor E]
MTPIKQFYNLRKGYSGPASDELGSQLTGQLRSKGPLWIYRDPKGYKGSTGVLRVCENKPVHMIGDVALATLWDSTVVPDAWGGFWHKGGGPLGGLAKSVPEVRDISKCSEKSFCEIDFVYVRTSPSRYAGALLTPPHRRARVGRNPVFHERRVGTFVVANDPAK